MQFRGLGASDAPGPNGTHEDRPGLIRQFGVESEADADHVGRLALGPVAVGGGDEGAVGQEFHAGTLPKIRGERKPETPLPVNALLRAGGGSGIVAQPFIFSQCHRFIATATEWDAGISSKWAWEPWEVSA